MKVLSLMGAVDATAICSAADTTNANSAADSTDTNSTADSTDVGKPQETPPSVIEYKPFAHSESEYSFPGNHRFDSLLTSERS